MAQNIVLSPFQILAQKALESGHPQIGGQDMVNAFKDSVAATLKDKIRRIRSEQQQAYAMAVSSPIL